MNKLKENLKLILKEKEEKIIPENLKDDVTIFGIKGNLDTFDSKEENACLVIAKNILGSEVI